MTTLFRHYTINRLATLLLAILTIQTAVADNTRFSLLTCSPGEEVYELFGHTALRYTNEEMKQDVVFGYGYFSFDTPNFVWRFILGETDYLVGAVEYMDFIKEYEQRGAGVTEQVLQMDSLQKEALFDALVANCHPQKRVYRYNYFYNNCTTKVRDKVLEQFAGKNITFANATQEKTLRETIAGCTAGQPWTAFGINLLLGADIDKPATRETLQFLPANLMNDLATAQADGKPIVSEQTELCLPVDRTKRLNHFTPFNSALLLLLFTMIIMLCEVRSHKLFWGYDILLMGLQGIAGVVLMFMALFSQHPAVGNNYLLILLNPIPLLLIPLLVRSAIKQKSFSFMWVQTAIPLLFIASAPFVPQCYPIPVFIFAITIAVRSLFHIYRLKICDLNIY